MTSKKKGTPSNTSTAFFAAQAMRLHGPQTRQSILLLADFGNTPGRQADNLKRSMLSGWLAEQDGVISLSAYALHYFDGEPEPETVKAPQGSMATPRENVNAMLPLSAKHRPNVRGMRLDAPDVRQYPSHYAKVTP